MVFVGNEANETSTVIFNDEISERTKQKAKELIKIIDDYLNNNKK